MVIVEQSTSRDAPRLSAAGSRTATTELRPDELRTRNLIDTLKRCLPEGSFIQRLQQRPESFMDHDPPEKILEALWALSTLSRVQAMISKPRRGQMVVPSSAIERGPQSSTTHANLELFAAAVIQLCSPAVFSIFVQHLSLQDVRNFAQAINAPARLREGPLKESGAIIDVRKITHKDWLDAMAASLHGKDSTRLLDYLAFLPEERSQWCVGVDPVRDLCRREVQRVWLDEYIRCIDSEERTTLRENGKRLNITLTTAGLRLAVENDDPGLIDSILRCSNYTLRGEDLVRALDFAARTNRSMTVVHLADLIMRDTNATVEDKVILRVCLSHFREQSVVLPEPELQNLLEMYARSARLSTEYGFYGRLLNTWSINGPWLCERPSKLPANVRSILEQNLLSTTPLNHSI